MGEEVVLAQLSIDSKGVVRGADIADSAVARTATSLNRLERSGKTTEKSLRGMGLEFKGLGGAISTLGPATDAVVGKMFNFQQAFSAVARSLGVVGLITGLAFAIKGLVSDLVSSTTWFQNARNAVNDWWLSITKGETAVGQLSRRMKEIGSVKTIISVMGELEQRVIEANKALDLMQSQGVSKALQQDTINRYRASIRGLIDELYEMGAAQEQVAATGAGVFAATLPSRSGPELGPGNQSGIRDFMEEQAKRSAAALEKEKTAALADAEAVRGLNLIISQHRIEQMGLEQQLDATIQEFELLQIKIQGINPIPLGELGAFLDLAAKNTEMLSIALDSGSAAAARLGEQLRISISNELDFAAFKTQSLQQAFVTMGQAVGAAASGIGNSSKLFFAEMLQGLAQVLAALGATLIATGVEQDNYGKVAAGVAAIAAAEIASTQASKYSAAAQEAGAGGGPGGRGGQTSSTGQSSEPTSNRPTIVINVHGSMIGTDTDNLARDIVKWSRTATADGA